jgi:hypothetical protein
MRVRNRHAVQACFRALTALLSRHHAAQLWPTGGVASFRDFVADVAGVAAAAAVIVARSGDFARWRSATPPSLLAASGVPLQEV